MIDLLPANLRPYVKALAAALGAVLAAVLPLVAVGETRPLVYILAVCGALGLGGGLTYAAPPNTPKP